MFWDHVHTNNYYNDKSIQNKSFNPESHILLGNKNK